MNNSLAKVNENQTAKNTTDKNLKTEANTDPKNAPIPAFVAFLIEAPPSHSNRNAKINGAINIHIIGGGINIPTNTPINAPTAPLQVAPNFFAPIHVAKISINCESTATKTAVPTNHQDTGESGNSNLNPKTPTPAIKGPGKTGRNEPRAAINNKI